MRIWNGGARKLLIAGCIFVVSLFGVCSVSADPIAEVGYTVSFVDAEDYNTHIFFSQEGSVPEGTAVRVDYPDAIIGNDGCIWTAVNESPQVFEVYEAGTHKYYIEYNQGERVVEEEDPDSDSRSKLEDWIDKAWKADCDITGEDASSSVDPYLVVTQDSENNRRLRTLISQINDTEWHVVYMIGENYNPSTVVIGTEFNATYSSVEMDSFSIDDKDYIVTRVRVQKKYDPETCEHRWSMKTAAKNTCLSDGSQEWECGLCESTKTARLPATGHKDFNGDTLCDSCGSRFVAQSLGAKLTTTLSVDGSDKELTFTCVDVNYAGTGHMLYICDSVLGQDIVGSCYKDTDYNNSLVRNYLNLDFANGITVSGALQDVERADGEGVIDKAFLLSKTEYEAYASSGNLVSTGSHFLRTANGEDEMYRVRDGVVETIEFSNESTGIRPAILLKTPVTDEEADETVWKEGDVQIRQVGDDTLSFTCVDADYSDWQDGHRKAALFLCDSVIRADVITAPDDTVVKAISFGQNNNYKTSDVREWLMDAADNNSFNLEPIHTGINTGYTGSTVKGEYEQLSQSRLSRYDIGYQLMQDQLFCLSVEEALEYKSFLWKFGSETNNQRGQMSAYSQGYYLRTPFYETNDEGAFAYGDNVYVVNLDGSIHPADVNSETYGMRPAFAIPQQ